MNSADAIAVLATAFRSDGCIVDAIGNPTYEFVGDFDFVATDVDDHIITISADLPGLGVAGTTALKRRLLEANMMGSETGSGRIAVDPMDPDGYALVDVVELSFLDEDDFKLRIINFMLYVEYWRAEGISDLLAEIKAESLAPSEDEMLIRV